MADPLAIAEGEETTFVVGKSGTISLHFHLLDFLQASRQKAKRGKGS